MSDMFGQMIRTARHRGHTRPRPFPATTGYVDVVIQWEAGVPDHQKDQVKRRWGIVVMGPQDGDIEQGIMKMPSRFDLVQLQLHLKDEPAIVDVSVSPSTKAGFQPAMMFGLEESMNHVSDLFSFHNTLKETPTWLPDAVQQIRAYAARVDGSGMSPLYGDRMRTIADNVQFLLAVEFDDSAESVMFFDDLLKAVNGVISPAGEFLSMQTQGFPLIAEQKKEELWSNIRKAEIFFRDAPLVIREHAANVPDDGGLVQATTEYPEFDLPILAPVREQIIAEQEAEKAKKVVLIGGIALLAFLILK